MPVVSLQAGSPPLQHVSASEGAGTSPHQGLAHTPPETAATSLLPGESRASSSDSTRSRPQKPTSIKPPERVIGSTLSPSEPAVPLSVQTSQRRARVHACTQRASEGCSRARRQGGVVPARKGGRRGGTAVCRLKEAEVPRGKRKRCLLRGCGENVAVHCGYGKPARRAQNS